MGYAKRKDMTQQAIVEGLENEGKVVVDVSMVPNLGMDVIVYDPDYRRWVPLEIKSSEKTRHRAANDKLTRSQLRVSALAPVAVVETLTEALRELERANHI